MVALGGLVLAACQPGHPGTSVSDNSDAALAAAEAAGNAAVMGVESDREAARPEHFTKDGFSDYVYGMTKSRLRAQFGPPDAVHDMNDSWYYSRLPIFDQDAGIQVPVTVQFMGIGGPEDEVAHVRY